MAEATTKVDRTSRIQQLRFALRESEASAFLVEPRVIRRLIRERFGFAKLSATIPHTDSQVVAIDDLRHLVHPDELGLVTFAGLPDYCLLLCEPEEDQLEHWPLQELLQQVWRRLFHAKVDQALAKHYSQPRGFIEAQSKIAQLGQVEFDEAHFVLRHELRLLDPNSRLEAWRELVAVYLELRQFEPSLIPVWFPSLSRRPNADTLLAGELHVDALFDATKLQGAILPNLTEHALQDEARLGEARRRWSLGIGFQRSDRSYIWQLRRRDRANDRGNTVLAAACAIRAGLRSTSDDKFDAATGKARLDVARLVERLQAALAFPQGDSAKWQASLWELTKNSVHGFWNSEKRLLYDLQRVCLDHERVTYRVDLVKWVVTRGKRPLRRPLNNLREVMMAKHLASAAKRLPHVRLSGLDRERLTGLIHHAAELSEVQLRNRMRPVFGSVLKDVDLSPNNVLEQVAFDKLIEDSLDCIVDRGYLTMGYLRDSISKNDLKLPDIQELREVWQGDHLLRADDRFDVALDGVYRRGEFYLRWLQITSAIFFGTPAGRFATLYVIIPFGGALVIVEGVKHVIHMLPHHIVSPVMHGSSAGDASTETPDGEQSTTEEHSASTTQSLTLSPVRFNSVATLIDEQNSLPKDGAQQTSSPKSTTSVSNLATNSSQESTGKEDIRKLADTQPPDGNSSGDLKETRETIAVPPKSTDEAVDQIVERQFETLSWVLLLGFLLMGLIHWSAFRKLFLQGLTTSGRLLKTVLLDGPLQILNLPAIQALLRNRTFVRIRRVAISPAIIAYVGGACIPWLFTGKTLGYTWIIAIGILLSAILNSRLGRDTQELTAEWFGNTWQELRARIVVAFLDWIMDLFRTLLNLVERFIYAVDEFLLFHSGESWISVVAKAVLGVLWSFVSFLIRIYVNLLIEPTFHPVKHFPVVTVAHKIFLPALIMLEGNMVHFLAQYLGIALARSVTWFNIFFLPGFFGFAVWELKENWRLYRSNRQRKIGPSVVGSHGETIARLLRPGFHSGTLPKIYRKLRRLETKEASFRRFSARRSCREQLEHVEHAISNFVNRELIRLLEQSEVWKENPLRCGSIESASNNFSIELHCPSLGNTPTHIVFQEQCGWIAVSVMEPGWLRFASVEQRLSFSNALVGFYRKCGIDLIREQVEGDFVHDHPYDIQGDGLLIWPDANFSEEIHVNLYREGKLKPQPSDRAALIGILPKEQSEVVFSESITTWSDWERTWETPLESGVARRLPLACTSAPQVPVLRAEKRS